MPHSTTPTHGLLPTGMYEYLPPHAARRREAISKFLQFFTSYGYLEVSPPLVEFETNILSNQPHRIHEHTFRVMDPDTHQMLMIRSDLTMQVARLAETSLHHYPRPLRICYADTFLWAKPRKLSPSRSDKQIGIELIGSSAIEADFEVIRLSIESLRSLDISHISLDLHVAPLCHFLLDQEDPDIRSSIEEAINQKDKDKLTPLALEHEQLWLYFMDIQADIKAFYRKVAALSLPENARNSLHSLKQLTDLINKHYPELTLTIDPLERGGFNYHTGISFAIFDTDNAAQLARGGRYLLADSKEPAVGVSFYLQPVLDLLSTPEECPSILVPGNCTIEETKSLHAKGYHVYFALSDILTEEAKQLAITHIYSSDKKIVEIPE